MARFVNQREHVVEHVRLVVHEDEGLRVEAAAGECPALLAAVLVTVAPAVLQPMLERIAILASQRLHGGQRHFDRLVPRVADLLVVQNGDVAVVMVDLLQPHLPPPHFVVVVECGKLAMDRRKQVIVHRNRHVVGKQGRGNGGGEIADLGVINVALVGPVQRSRQRVLIGRKLLVVLMKRRPANVAAGRIQQRLVARMAQLDGLALLVLDYAELHVAIEKLMEDLAARLGHLALHRQQPLFFLAERMRPEADNPRQQKPIRLHAGSARNWSIFAFGIARISGLMKLLAWLASVAAFS